MTVTVSKPVRRRPVFHALPVATVDRLTDDAVAISFGVPPELRETFAFQAGQHLTVRRVDATTGEDVRRSYSICSTPADLATAGILRVGVKEIPGGAFSTYAARALHAGDAVEVMPPLGHFTTDFDPDRRRDYGAIAAGSGITPVLSLAATALATEPASTFTLLYGNRYARSVMFAEELADLKDRDPARLRVLHALSREEQESELLSGRLDANRLARIFDALIAPEVIDEWFLCGPFGMVEAARGVLADRAVPDAAVHVELFHVAAEPAAPRRPTATEPRGADATDVTILLDGRSSSFRMGRHERVLDAALKVRGELPYACKSGVCSTCRARLVSGEVTMARNYALEADEMAAGYVLTCQASPVSDKLVVDYDA
ncbi:MAG TPA: 1,2-phenylacetyl-CoA epoxidase subunit PaaE [Pilimelia sp.]|nr:1,2-phenylacetyl-CoA epoxidase subunit PaaE [Pilimelia sp.]